MPTRIIRKKVDKSIKIDKSKKTTTTTKKLTVKPKQEQKTTQKVIVQIGQNVVKGKRKVVKPRRGGGGGPDSGDGKPPKDLRIPPTPQVARQPYIGASRDAASLASLMGGYIKTSQPMSIDQLDTLRGRVNKLESELDKRDRLSGLGFSRSLNEVEQIPRLEPIPTRTEPIIQEYQTMRDEEKKENPPEIKGSSAAKTEYHTVGQTLQQSFKNQPLWEPETERKHKVELHRDQIIDLQYLSPIPKAIQEKYRKEMEEARKVKSETPTFIKTEDKPKIIGVQTPAPLTPADVLTTSKKERFRDKFEKLFGSRSDRGSFDSESQRRMMTDWEAVEGRSSQSPKQWYSTNKFKYFKINKKPE